MTKSHKVRFSLDITHCIYCGADLLHDDFPHYCPICLEYIQKYRRSPEIKNRQDALLDTGEGDKDFFIE